MTPWKKSLETLFDGQMLPIHSIIVEYGKKDYTLPLLSDLLEGGSRAVTIVENGLASPTESVTDVEVAEFLTAAINNIEADKFVFEAPFIPVRLIKPRLNLGFGAGVNSAVTSIGECQVDTVLFEVMLDDQKKRIVSRQLTGSNLPSEEFLEIFRQPYLLISNNDIQIKPGALSTLVGLIKRNGYAVVAPKLLNSDNTVYPSARRFPSVTTAVGYSLATLVGAGSNNRFVKNYKSYESFPLIDAGRGIYSVDWVSGAFFIVDYSIFTRLGGFDEGFFLYLEDVDLCHRIKALGEQVAYATNCEVMHIGSVSINNESKKAFYHHKSAFRYERKTAKGWRKLLLPLAFVFLALRGIAVVSVDRIKSQFAKK
jgi:GT2 family glycosyltransferase